MTAVRRNQFNVDKSIVGDEISAVVGVCLGGVSRLAVEQVPKAGFYLIGIGFIKAGALQRAEAVTNPSVVFVLRKVYVVLDDLERRRLIASSKSHGHTVGKSIGNLKNDFREPPNPANTESQSGERRRRATRPGSATPSDVPLARA